MFIEGYLNLSAFNDVFKFRGFGQVGDDFSLEELNPTQFIPMFSAVFIAAIAQTNLFIVALKTKFILASNHSGISMNILHTGHARRFFQN